MKKDYQKAFKKFTFLLNPVPFNGQNYQKQKGPGINDQLVGLQITKEVQKNSFISYIHYLNKFDDVI